MSELKKTDISDMDFGGVVPSAAPLKHAASGDVFWGFFSRRKVNVVHTACTQKRQ